MINALYEPVFYDKNGKSQPINSKTIDEYLYGSDYVNHQFNKLVKLYGSGTLNQTQISAIRDLFIKMEEVGMLINTPEQNKGKVELLPEADKVT